MQLPQISTPIQELISAFISSKKIKIWVKRDDLTHSEIMGNKWRKLKYNLEEAKRTGAKTIVTFGGAYSNHIAATAAAARLYGFKSIGIIRGEELTPNSNVTLTKAASNGMNFQFVSREKYRKLKDAFPKDLYMQGKCYYIPEGGTNALAIKGCREIIDEIDREFDVLITAIGTGGTFAGLVKGLNGNKEVWGFSALKGNWIVSSISELLSTEDINHKNYRIFDDKKFGGYGKFDQQLIQFILDFRQEYDILLDPIYTGKVFLGVWDMIKNDQIAPGCRLILLHTGGLQGIAGFNQRFNMALPEPE